MAEVDNIIKVNNITKIYGKGDTAFKALDNVSLNIKTGEFIMITGRNGSGKSTLLHQLGLLDKPNIGDIIINNCNVSDLSEKKRTRWRLNQIGYIFQEYALVTELSALENVMLPAMMLGKKKDARKKAEKLLQLVDLEKKMKRLPTQLSGGEQQRVAIARSLVNEPLVLIADEPTANLDSHAAKDVLDIFTKLNKDHQHTIIMVTHEQEELIYATRIIKLADGKII